LDIGKWYYGTAHQEQFKSEPFKNATFITSTINCQMSHRHSSRRIASTGGFGITHLGAGDDEHAARDDLSETEQTSGDLDFDFAITDSGRTVAHLIAHLKEDDNMDFSIANSGQSMEQLGNHAPENAAAINSDARNNMDCDGFKQEFVGDTDFNKGIYPIHATRSNTKDIPFMSIVPSLLATKSLAGSHESSGSTFNTDIMNENSHQLSHTPPSAASYETRHFGKRARAGSVSGRLRSASDLEENGIIDRQQKGVLKDLIIAGDEALQAALDRYEMGDKSSLQNMIQSGALSDRVSTDIDLLGDLDLDFLTVDDASFSDHIESMGASKGLSVSFPSKVVTNCESYLVTPAYDDDTIGDLDFNGGYEHEHDGDTGSYASSLQDEQDRRYRSNSLAYGALANEPGVTENTPAIYDQWTDHEPSNQEGGINIRRSVAHPIATGGLAESLAQYDKSKNELKVSKARQAEERRKAREDKKLQKDREKEEKKLQKELEKQEKKDKKDREKLEQQKKVKPPKKPKEQVKESVVDAQEEKIIESGTGRPRSMSDPNIKTSLDSNGLLQVERPDGWVGAYSPDSRKMRIDRFLAKRTQRVWTKSVKYDVRKNFADSRLRVKGRFVKKEDELLMRELMSLT